MLLKHGTKLRQGGFTLVELLVAAALAITIMWILAESFKMGIDFARSARSTGDMMTQLNNAGQILTRDLQAQHFLQPGAMRNINSLNNMPDMITGVGVTPPPKLIPFLSPAGTNYTPPPGYFRLVSPPPTSNAYSFTEPTEFFTVSTTNPNTTLPVNGQQVGCQLAFTSFLPGGLPQNYFMATSPVGSSNVYYSRTAELAYFLGSHQGAGTPTGFTPPIEAVTSNLLNEQPALQAFPQLTTAQPLYNLYRRQRLVAQNTDFAQLQQGTNPAPPNLSAPVWPTTPSNQPNQYYDQYANDVISYTQFPANQTPQYQVNTMAPSGPFNGGLNQAYTFKTPTPSQMPAWTFRSLPLQPNYPNLMQPLGFGALSDPRRTGDDILLTNVLSFEVLATWVPAPYMLPAVNPAYGAMQPPPKPGLPLQAIPYPRPFTVAPGYTTPSPNIAGAPTYPSSSSVPLNSNYPYDYLPHLRLNPSQPYTFDTWYQTGPTTTGQAWNNFAAAPFNNNLLPMPARLTGLQITIRIYDPKTKQARQNTWRVAL